MIVEAIGLSLLQHGCFLLKGNQRLVLARCISGLGENNAWLLHAAQLTVEQPEEYYSNAEEADNRIWQHAVQCHANVILIYSPDTDVYNIGLSHLSQRPNTTYVIQLNMPHSDEKSYININNLKLALTRDSDLGNLSQGNELCQILQSLFISTGSDYISYLKFIGKATVLNNFFQFASFICGHNVLGCLHQTSDDKHYGFLSFIRLVETC